MYKIEDNYKFSNVFGSIESELNTIENVITEFIVDGINLVDEKQKKIDEIFEKIEKIDSEQAAIFDQHEYEPNRLKNIDLKNTFLSSGMSYLYSQFEFYIHEIAARSKEFFGSEISEEIYKHKSNKFNRGIQKTRSYLIDTFHIDITDKEEDWVKINNFRIIRNYFVHNNGNIFRGDNVKNFIEKTPHISLFNDEIILTKEFVIENSYTLINYLRLLMDRLYEKRKMIQVKSKH